MGAHVDAIIQYKLENGIKCAIKFLNEPKIVSSLFCLDNPGGS